MPRSKRVANEIEEISQVLGRNVTCDKTDLSWYLNKIESVNERYCRERNYLKPAYECFYTITENGVMTRIDDPYEYYKDRPEEFAAKVAFSKSHLRGCIVELNELMGRIPQR